MSNTIGSGFGILPNLIANSANVRQQLDTLTEQVSTGSVSQTYSGLGDRAGVALSLNPQIATLKAYQANISQATGSMQITQTAMTQMQSIAATFVAAIPNLNGLNASEVDSVAAQARAALKQVAGLLNSQYAGKYMFAGQDTANPPVPSGDNILSSGFYTQINTAVAGLSASGASATAAATLAIASSNTAGTSPFSTYLSQPVSAISTSVVQTGDSVAVQTGLLASGNSTATSSGVSTGTSTGSYMRDLMRSLATLGSMSSSQVNDPGFSGLVAATGTSLNGVVGAMAIDAGEFGDTQAALAKTQTQLSDTTTALSGQLSSVQDVDMAAALSKLTAMQSQLQASYKLIASENSLSLLNFLPASA